MEVKEIQNKAVEFIKANQDFSKEIVEFQDLLREVDENIGIAKDKKDKIINLFLKHSKKKPLFNYEVKASENEDFGSDRTFEIGLNIGGLGIARSYQDNLRNFKDYWLIDDFVKLIKIKDFRTKLLESVKLKLDDEQFKLLTYIFKNYTGKKDYEKEIEVENNGIKIRIRRGNFDIVLSDRYDDDLDIIKSDELKDFGNDKLAKEYKQYLDITFKDLLKFDYLIKNKDKLNKMVSENKTIYTKINEKIKADIEKVDVQLKPYEALESI